MILAFSKVRVVRISEALACKDLVITNFRSFEAQAQLEAPSFKVAIFTQVTSSFSLTKASIQKVTFITFLKAIT